MTLPLNEEQLSSYTNKPDSERPHITDGLGTSLKKVTQTIIA